MDRRKPGVLPWCKGWKCFSMSFHFISFIQDDYNAFGSLYTQKFMEKLFYNFILFARVVSQPWKGVTRQSMGPRQDTVPPTPLYPCGDGTMERYRN